MSSIHFQLISIYGMIDDLNFIFLALDVQLC